MKVAYFMIIHYTYGWTQRFVRSFFQHFPDKELIVINNNPGPSQIVLKTRGHRGQNDTWNELCQSELQYLNQPQITVHEMPREPNNTYELPTHGEVLDYAFKWLSHYDYIWHLEPDCKINGTLWHKRAWEARNATVVGLGQIHKEGPIAMSICPTLWNTEKVLKLKMSFKKRKPNINTGQHILRECVNRGEAKVVPNSDFIHYSGGTKRCPFMML